MTYRFLKEELVTVWRQTLVETEADSEPEALNKVAQDDYEVVDSEYLYDTENEVPIENYVGPTEEIWDKTRRKRLWSNV